MSTRRPAGSDCPLLDRPLDPTTDCRSCRFYRGESRTAGIQAVVCNYPRDGSYIEPGPSLFDHSWWNEQMAQ